MLPLSDQLLRTRRYLKAHAPYVRRREYRILQRRCEKMTDAFTIDYRPARAARLDVIKPLAADSSEGEICLFVTHADRPRIKPHVIHHIACLVSQGFKVVLIINTDISSGSMELDPTMIEHSSAVYVRENVGFDFAAWGHAYFLGNGFPLATRLLLTNDSIIGPLSVSGYSSLIERLRKSPADVVGLTENYQPVWHIQSFFLAFNARALAHEKIKRLFASMMTLPDKDTVIVVYELSLGRQMRTLGLQCEALFPARFRDARSGNDTGGRWQQLVDSGFPFIKGSVALDPKNAKAVAKILEPLALLRGEK